MKHFTHIADLGVEGVARVLARAAVLKATPQRQLFGGRVLAMLFFNPSLRTRVSFETAMLRGGGHAVVLNAGQDNWKLEDQPGAVMDGDKPEHLRDAIPVMSGYVDALAVRSFASSAGVSARDLSAATEGRATRDADEQDGLLGQIRALASVPVISMESAREHPCQGLADMLTIQEHLGELAGRRLVLSWAPHIKPLPLAVPHSFLLSAAACGAQLTVAHPPGFELHPAVLAEAEAYARQSGASISFSQDQRSACADAEVVYAKSWGPVDRDSAAEELTRHADWLVDKALLEGGSCRSRLMHCLPVRRNVEVADDALDSELSLTLPQAQNRYHVQVALLDLLLNGGKDAG